MSQNTCNKQTLSSSDRHLGAEQLIWDVVIIGGGPGGTTAASLLADKGWKVLLLEKERHPRFHIGESLLPNNLPILERLGVLHEVSQIGVVKAGADFTLDEKGSETQTFRFDRALGNSPSYSYEVKRSEFDQLLFENCRKKGADARQLHRVTNINLNTRENLQEVSCLDDDGEKHNFLTRYIIDASGRHGFMANKNQWRIKNPNHSSAAIFGHFKNVPRRPGADAGNISIYWFDYGWIWMIPIANDTMSIGAVCLPEYLKSRSTDTETFLFETLKRSPAAKERTKQAEAITPVRATGNYSYRSSQLLGKGYLLVGDSYAFIDPVFSSGVYLAMNSAEQCVPVVEAWLKGDAREYEQLSKRYQRTINKKIASFSWFIYKFTTPTMRDMFKNPRNDWQVEQAVISMLAGDGNGSTLIRNRILLFKLIFYLSRFRSLGESFHFWRRKRRNIKEKFEDEQVLM